MYLLYLCTAANFTLAPTESYAAFGNAAVGGPRHRANPSSMNLLAPYSASFWPFSLFAAGASDSPSAAGTALAQPPRRRRAYLAVPIWLIYIGRRLFGCATP